MLYNMIQRPIHPSLFSISVIQLFALDSDLEPFAYAVGKYLPHFSRHPVRYLAWSSPSGLSRFIN